MRPQGVVADVERGKYAPETIYLRVVSIDLGSEENDDGQYQGEGEGCNEWICVEVELHKILSFRIAFKDRTQIMP